MKVTAGTRKTAFVVASILLSVILTYLACLREPPVYVAEVQFQIATAAGASKPDLAAEKKLILSDSLLGQVLKDNNILPSLSLSGFRGLSLGGSVSPVLANINYIEMFREHLKVTTYPNNAAMALSYSGHDAGEVKKILETLFEKYRDWRQQAQRPGFDSHIIEADQNLAQKRENFLQSQKAFLDFVASEENNETSQAVLKNKQHELSAQIEALKLRYGPRHPAMIEALRQKQILDQQFIQASVDGRKAALKNKMDNDFRVLDEAMKASVILAQQKSTTQSAFKILPIGDVQVHAVSQYLSYKLVFAALAGLLISLAYMLLRERVSSVFHDRHELAKAFRYPVLASLSGLFKADKKDNSLPSGTSFDQLKTLRQELKLLGSEESPVKLVIVTSSDMEAGRGELVSGLGRVAARANEKVLILDADLRSPDLQRILPSPASRNLVDYLSGQARVDDIISRSDPSGVHVIYATPVPNTALDLLSSEKMKNFLISVREVYDLVLVVAPLALRGPDARVLAGVSDQTLYLVRADKTQKKDVRDGMALFPDHLSGKISFILTS